MKQFFISFLLVLFAVSCLSQRQDNEQILIKKTDGVEYTLNSLKYKEENGQKQCSKYERFRVDSAHISYYGPDFKQLLSFLVGVKAYRISVPDSLQNRYFSLTIKKNGYHPDTIKRQVKADILKFYHLSEQIKKQTTKRFVLSVIDSTKLMKYLDMKKRGYYGQSENDIKFKSESLNRIAAGLDGMYAGEEIVLDSNICCNDLKFSFKIKKGDIDKVKTKLKKYGLSLRSEKVSLTYYSYQ